MFQFPRTLFSFSLGVFFGSEYIFFATILKILYILSVLYLSVFSPLSSSLKFSHIIEPYLRWGMMYVIHAYVYFHSDAFFHLSICSIFIALSILLCICSIWSFQFSFSSMYTPKYLYFLTIGYPSNSCSWFLLDLLLKNMTPDFFLLIVILFLSVQFSIILMALLSSALD